MVEEAFSVKAPAVEVATLVVWLIASQRAHRKVSTPANILEERPHFIVF